MVAIFLSKGGPNLFIGKATQRLPKYEDGLIMVLKIDCFEQKLGTRLHFEAGEKKKIKTLWPLFMDGIQLPQG